MRVVGKGERFMPLEKVGFEDSLKKLVVPELCVGCGSCVAFCPMKCLEYSDGLPRLVGRCTECGICFQVCPSCGPPQEEIERLIFGRERRTEEEFGVYRRVVVAQTTDRRIREVCQDGGLVTSLLTFALEEGLIEGAIVSCVSEEEPLKPVPKLATTVEEIIECAGTRYVYSPNPLAFREALARRVRSLAFVGTPCQIRALRRMEIIPLKRYSSALKLLIGLFCSESFTYEGFVVDGIKRKLGVDPKDVKKVNIKGKVLVTTVEGEVKALPIEDAKKYSWNCGRCGDFSAELADISAGGVGLQGWTLTIIRTERGETLLKRAEEKGLIRVRPVEEEPKAYRILVNLSRRKRGHLFRRR